MEQNVDNLAGGGRARSRSRRLRNNKIKVPPPKGGGTSVMKKSEVNFFVNVAYKLINGHTHLLHGVAVAHGYAAVGFGIIKQKYPRRTAGVHP